MMKIAKSVGVIVFVGAVVAGATGAFFSDTESSIGNVFTAGTVTLELQTITHTYKDNVLPDPTGFTLNPPVVGQGPSFTFTDLKPLDWGTITGTLKNGANDTFVCARVTGVTDQNPFRNMLKFRTGTGPGGSFGDIVDAVSINEWFSPTPPVLNLPSLPMLAGQSESVPLQYCFGTFIQGGGCELDPAVVDYNAAQNQALSIDIEYYAVQQRNNEGFTCAGMNVPFSAVFVANEADAVSVIGGATVEDPLGKTASVEDVYGQGTKFSLALNEVGGDMIFVASTPFAVTGSDNSLSVLIDSNGDGLANFQYEYTNDNVIYKEVVAGNWTVVGSAPAGYSAVMNGGSNELTVTVPKAVLSSPFKVGANATNNGAAGFGGTNVGMSIPTGDLFNGGASNWTSSTNYQTVNW